MSRNFEIFPPTIAKFSTTSLAFSSQAISPLPQGLDAINNDSLMSNEQTLSPRHA